MKKIEPGLLLLLVAMFFAIVAGGHVSLDARPLQGSPIGILATLLAAFCVPLGVWFLMRKEGENDGVIGSVLIGLAGVIVVADAHPKFNMFQGGEMFATVRLLVALMVFGGLTHVLLKQRVVQMPGAWYGGLVVLIVTAMGTSVLVSEFKSVSLDAWSYWLIYGAAFYLTIATVGRVRGPRLLLETIVAAASFVALKGIVEFVMIREAVPTHRIFADWNNPNALAGLLVVAIPLALALSISAESVTRRVVSVLGGGVVLAALVLTQSKGGLLVAPIGIVVFMLAALVWKSGKRSLFGLVPIAVGALIFGLIQITAPKTDTPGAPLQRLTQAGGEQAQSTDFRKLLWRGALDLFEQSPVGHGAGTYRFISAKSGLHEQTQLTHQSFLQLAVEGGALALVGIVGLGLAWTVRMFLGAKALDLERNILRAGVLGAVVACAANGFLESNLFYFGTGLLMFVLIGAGLQLASDGTSPESMPAGLRYMIVCTCCALPLGLSIWSMRAESAKLAVVNALASQDTALLAASLDALDSTNTFDDESIYLRAMLGSETEQQRIELLQSASDHGPRTKHLRALASAFQKTGDTSRALMALERALFYDPNNLRTLNLRLEIEIETDSITSALTTADRLIAVEEKSYLQVRAIPEYVPTETFQARLFLVTQTSVPSEKTKLLRKAVDGFVRYADITIPKILQMVEGGMPSFAGDTRLIAEEKMRIARAAAVELIALYRSLGDDQSAEEVEALSERLTLDSTSGL